MAKGKPNIVDEIVLAPPGLQEVRFTSVGDFSEWITKEITALQPLIGTAGGVQYAVRMVQVSMDSLTRLKEIARGATELSDIPLLIARISGEQANIVPSDSLPGALILTEPDKSIAQIMFALQLSAMGQKERWYSNYQIPPVEKFALAASKLSPIYQPAAGGEPLLQLFSKLQTVADTRFAETLVEQKRATTDFTRNASEIENQRTRQSNELKNRFTNNSARLMLKSYRLFKKRERELDHLRATFIEHMRLAGPADYWTRKAEYHRSNRKNLRWLVAGVILAAIALTTLSYSWIASHSDPAHVGLIIILSPAVLVCLWGARLVFRAYNRNDDLLHDAEQRKILAQTYLALTKEGAAQATEGERFLVLQALVRPDMAREDEISGGSLVELLKVATTRPH